MLELLIPDGCQETVVMEHGNGSFRSASTDPWPYTGVFPLEALQVRVYVCCAIDTVCASFLFCSRSKWYKTIKNLCGEVVLYLLCICHSHFLRFLGSCVSPVPGHVNCTQPSDYLLSRALSVETLLEHHGQEEEADT